MFRFWPLGEYLGPESAIGFDSASGWIAEQLLRDGGHSKDVHFRNRFPSLPHIYFSTKLDTPYLILRKKECAGAAE